MHLFQEKGLSMRRLSIYLSPLILIVAVGLACGGSDTTTGTNAGGSPTTPAGPAKHLQIGNSAQVGDWQVTVNSAKTNSGSDFNKPQKAGNLFILIDVTMKNISRQQQVASSLGQFKLRNQAGEEMAIAIVTEVSPPPNGNVAAGSQVKGKLAYEVPKDAHAFVLEVTGGTISTDQVLWDIKV
jgi:hypothetical protein